MSRPHVARCTRRSRLRRWCRATWRSRRSPAPSPVTRARRSPVQSGRAPASAARSTTFAWTTLLQNESRALRGHVTPATLPASNSVRDSDRGSRAFTSSSGRSRFSGLSHQRDRTARIQGGPRIVRHVELRLAGGRQRSVPGVDTHRSVRQVYPRYEPTVATHRVDRLSSRPYHLVYDIPDSHLWSAWSAVVASLIRREIACSLPRTTLRTDRRRQSCKF